MVRELEARVPKNFDFKESTDDIVIDLMWYIHECKSRCIDPFVIADITNSIYKGTNLVPKKVLIPNKKDTEIIENNLIKFIDAKNKATRRG